MCGSNHACPERNVCQSIQFIYPNLHFECCFLLLTTSFSSNICCERVSRERSPNKYRWSPRCIYSPFSPNGDLWNYTTMTSTMLRWNTYKLASATIVSWKFSLVFPLPKYVHHPMGNADNWPNHPLQLTKCNVGMVWISESTMLDCQMFNKSS